MGAGFFHLAVGAFEGSPFFTGEAVNSVAGDFFEDGVDFFGDEGLGIYWFVFALFSLVKFGADI